MNRFAKSPSAIRRPLARPKIADLLEIERDCCARLQEIIHAERQAAAEYDLAALHACLKQREAVQAEWQRAAQMRNRQGAAGREELAASIARDPALADSVARLRRQAREVQQAQSINQALIRSVLGHVTDLLDVIRRELPESRYDGRACLTASLPAATGTRWSA